MEVFWKQYCAEVKESMDEHSKVSTKISYADEENKVDKKYSITEKHMNIKLHQSLQLSLEDREDVPNESSAQSQIEALEGMITTVTDYERKEETLNKELRNKVNELFTFADADKENEYLANYTEIFRMFSECSLDTSEAEQAAEIRLQELESQCSYLNSLVSDLTLHNDAVKKKLIEADPYDVPYKLLKNTLKMTTETLRAASKKLVNVRLQVRSAEMNN